MHSCTLKGASPSVLQSIAVAVPSLLDCSFDVGKLMPFAEACTEAMQQGSRVMDLGQSMYLACNLPDVLLQCTNMHKIRERTAGCWSKQDGVGA